MKELWDTWDVRVFILVSLLIQACLTFFAPMRKRSSNGWLMFWMWLLYLSADAVALFTIGKISSGNMTTNATAASAAQEEEMLALWAPFLLLHLGGPDTITALALADNDLWLRHALQLTTQVIVTLYVFGRAFGSHRHVGRSPLGGLLVPSLLMFMDGFIKYTERTCALYFACTDTFRDSQRKEPEAGPNYARLMEEYSSAVEASIPATFQGRDKEHAPTSLDVADQPPRTGESSSSSPLPSDDRALDMSPADNNHVVTTESKPQWFREKVDEETVKQAYKWYDKFKGLLADAFFGLKIRDESREYFLNKSPSMAFTLVEIELNFMYDAFYTKAFLLQTKLAYARFISFSSVIESLVWFSFQYQKYSHIDVGITFALYGGAIALDLISTVMFLTSNLSIAMPSIRHVGNLLMIIVSWFTRFTSRKWSRITIDRNKRWSETISQYNLLERCLGEDPNYLKLIPVRQLRDLIIGWLYVHQKPIDKHLGEFIFKELKKKAVGATNPDLIKEACGARGNLVFQEKYLLVSEYLRPWTLDMDYDESLLTWLLATDFCYYWKKENIINDYTRLEKEKVYREFSRQLSDYMSYLLLRQKTLLSAVVGTSDIRFDDTCAEAEKFTRMKVHDDQNHQDQDHDDDKKRIHLKQFCDAIQQVTADVPPNVAKGDKSKSVLFEANRLAQRLELLGECQWKITAKVWLELLSYAAVRCLPKEHVAELSKGGQLITLVWLLMAHLGLGERFRKTQGFGWTKLIIPK